VNSQQPRRMIGKHLKKSIEASPGMAQCASRTRTA
jgi:hypothetical protein